MNVCFDTFLQTSYPAICCDCHCVYWGTSWWSRGFPSYSTDLCESCFLAIEGKVNMTRVLPACCGEPQSLFKNHLGPGTGCPAQQNQCSTSSMGGCYCYCLFKFLIQDGSDEWNCCSLQPWNTPCYMQVPVLIQWKPVCRCLAWRFICTAKPEASVYALAEWS